MTTPKPSDKDREFTYTLTRLANAQEWLRKAQGQLEGGSAGGAVGCLLEAQKALSDVLVKSGQLVGRHQGKWPQ